MFVLKKPTAALSNEYKNKILQGLIGRVKSGRESNNAHIELSTDAKNILLPNWNTDNPNASILEQLLISEPVDLKNLNDNLMEQLDALIAPNKPGKNLLLKIFNYEGVFNDSSKSRAFWLAKKIERKTCVYCNRQYIFTVEKGNGNNKQERIARPVFDHWFPKDKYPLLSISLFNLIPSCTICNSSVKGSVDLSFEDHLHPYVDEGRMLDFTFKASKTIDKKPKWTVKINRQKDSKEDKTIKAFRLDEIYAMHGELEVLDIMYFKESYPDGYLSDLFDNLLKDCTRKMTKYDVYRMLFGTEMDSDKFLDRPFGKLKHDLLKEILNIDTKTSKQIQ
ncbi:hypothetical protein FQ707_11180 [Bacteroidaceae bacterium HV4-6-C5C]|nr:hypothetical protein FQ707_11180 [Bacteroidaceae bacterium HV4-6-C5C]